MNLRNNKGFTLVEMLVAMAIMGILGTLVMNFMMNGSTFYKKVYTDYDARNEARLAVHYITSRIRQNDSIDAITVDNNNQIIITVKDDKEIIQETDTIYYNKKDRKLYEQVSKDSKKLPKRKIADASSFEIKKLEKNTISMIIGYVDSSGVEKKYTETLTLRSSN